MWEQIPIFSWTNDNLGYTLAIMRHQEVHLVIANTQALLTVFEEKTKIMCKLALFTSTATMMEVEAAGQRYKRARSFTYLRGSITEISNLSTEIAGRKQRELYE